MKRVLKKLKVMFLIFAMLISNGSAIIMASNSGDVSISENIEVTNGAGEQLLNEDDGENSNTLFGTVPTYNVGDTLYFGKWPQTTTDSKVLEPIKWKVLSNDGQKALLITDQIIDFKHFYNQPTNPKNWVDSDLRIWLNDTFYNRAFDIGEKNGIRKETLTTPGMANTDDNVFVLSKDEINTHIVGTIIKRAKPTAYAQSITNINGVYLRVYNGYSGYWLRSNGSSSYIQFIQFDGDYGEYEGYDTGGWCGVRPSIYIDLQSTYFTSNESNITWDLNGGDWVTDDSTWKNKNKYREGVKTALPIANEVKKAGYRLKGWLINNATSPEIEIKETYTGNIRLKAVYVPEDERDLTDRENAAFIVRDEWINWVNSFTGELKELDKNATSRIYSNMDFYDMQYRFTEKYKKVPEYLDEDGKPTEKLKKMINEKRKELAGGNKKTKDYLKFTSVQNGSTVKYRVYGSVDSDLGYSKDGSTFIKWNVNEDITLDAGDYIYVRNKKETLNSAGDYVYFDMTGNIEASGNIMSLLSFVEDVPAYAFYCLFIDCHALTKAPELPAKKVAESSYANMFAGCTGLTEAPDLPATYVSIESYSEMFLNCSNLVRGPYIKATTFGGTQCFNYMFSGCTNLNYLKIDYQGAINIYRFNNWVYGVTATGTIYYNGPTNVHYESGIPTNFTVVPFTD